MKYSPLQDKSEGSSRSSEEYEEGVSRLSSSRGSGKLVVSRWVILTLVPVASIIIFVFGAWAGQISVKPNNICPSHVQKYSPILNEVDTEMYPVRFNGSFMKLNPFRMDAGPEVDAAWKSLGSDYKVVIVPDEEAKKAGLTKPGQVRVSDRHGGGYPANVEVLHQMHCLNLLRKATWYNYDYYVELNEGPFTNEERILKIHVSHCLDTLRQQLMCQPDTAFLGQIWWDKTAPKAFIDFDNVHTCKNYEAIRQWAEDHQLRYLLDDNVPVDFLEAPDLDIVAAEIP